MSLKTLLKADMEWLRATIKKSYPGKIYICPWIGGDKVFHIYRANSIICLCDETGGSSTALAYVNDMPNGDLIIYNKDAYEKLFPFNNTREDFLQTLYYIQMGDSRFKDLFYTKGGRLSTSNVDKFVSLIREGKINSVIEDVYHTVWAIQDIEYIRPIYDKFCEQQLFYEIILNNRYYPEGSAEFIYYRPTATEEVSSAYAYTEEIMRRLGFVKWPNDDDEETPWFYVTKEEYIRLTSMVTCKCGEKVPKNELYGHKCSKCITCPPEKLKILDYNKKADELFNFKAEKKGNKKDNLSFNDFYNRYMDTLGINIDSAKQTNLYIGAELEYECVDKEVQKVEVLEMLHEHAILKSDGSLHNGFEIVTKPALMEEHERIMKPFFDNFPEGLIPKDNCGLHFHVSRAPLSLLTQGKMLEFMNNIDNRSFLEGIAGRWSERWAKQSPSIKMSNILMRTSENRYQALNNSNKHTLEFRIFAPATTWENFAYKMEFCISLSEYCNPCNGFSLKEVASHESYLKWLSNKRKDFPNLHKKIFGERESKTKWVIEQQAKLEKAGL